MVTLLPPTLSAATAILQVKAQSTLAAEWASGVHTHWVLRAWAAHTLIHICRTTEALSVTFLTSEWAECGHCSCYLITNLLFGKTVLKRYEKVYKLKWICLDLWILQHYSTAVFIHDRLFMSHPQCRWLPSRREDTHTCSHALQSPHTCLHSHTARICDLKREYMTE